MVKTTVKLSDGTTGNHDDRGKKIWADVRSGFIGNSYCKLIHLNKTKNLRK